MAPEESVQPAKLNESGTLQKFVRAGLSQINLDAGAFALKYAGVSAYTLRSIISSGHKPTQKIALTIFNAFEAEGLSFSRQRLLSRFDYVARKDLFPRRIPRGAWGVWIHRVRNYHGLTQKEFADSLRVSDSSVDYWERGADKTSVKMLRQIYEQYVLPEFVGDGRGVFGFDQLLEQLYDLEPLSSLEEFGPLVKAARERAGLTQQELSSRSGVSKDNIEKSKLGGTTARRHPPWLW